MTIRTLALAIRARILAWRALGILLHDLTTQVDEDLIDVCATTRRSLVVRRIVPALCERKGFSARDGTVFFQVGFVADDHDGDGFVVFDADDLFAEFGKFLQ